MAFSCRLAGVGSIHPASSMYLPCIKDVVLHSRHTQSHSQNSAPFLWNQHPSHLLFTVLCRPHTTRWLWRQAKCAITPPATQSCPSPREKLQRQAQGTQQTNHWGRKESAAGDEMKTDSWMLIWETLSWKNPTWSTAQPRDGDWSSVGRGGPSAPDVPKLVLPSDFPASLRTKEISQVLQAVFKVAYSLH